ncbi:MAG: hypothetical protein IJ043_01540 [Clostridia bacterium]|nr:hypothetical protein [Clostridia bacterium]
MKREALLNTVFSQFDRSAKEFCGDTNGLFCEITSDYKGEERAENLRYRSAKIYYHSFIAEFKYTAHGLMNVTNSILECLIYPDKIGVIGIPLQFVVDFCQVDTATPLSIPFISNAPGMIQAFHCIGSVLKSLLEPITDICRNAEQKALLLGRFEEEWREVLEIKPGDNDAFLLLETGYTFFTLRFTATPFINFMKGHREKAIRQLSKTKKLLGYERRVLELWKREEAPEIPELSVIIKNAELYNQSGVQKANFKEFGAMFFSWILLTIGVSAVYTGFYFLLMYLEGRGSVYLMGPIYGFPYCILFAFITSIALSYFTRDRFYKLLYKKDWEQYAEMDSIQNGGGSDKLMKGFLAVLVAASLAGCILLVKWNANFLPSGFWDNTKFFSLQGEYHSYQEVERVYYKPDRVNGFGETIDSPSYVLVFKDGKELDFYEYDEITQYENELLDFLQEKGITIEKRSPVS